MLLPLLLPPAPALLPACAGLVEGLMSRSGCSTTSARVRADAPGELLDPSCM